MYNDMGYIYSIVLCVYIIIGYILFYLLYKSDDETKTILNDLDMYVKAVTISYFIIVWPISVIMGIVKGIINILNSRK